MENKKNEIVENFKNAFIISSIAYAIIFAVYKFLPICFPIISTSQNDAWLLSNYVTIDNYRNRPVADFDIVVCDLEGIMSRDSIALAIEKIESFSPKVIGCDIIFSQSSGVDTVSTNTLKRVIESYDNIILATRVIRDRLGNMSFIEESIFNGGRKGNIAVSTDGMYERTCRVNDSIYVNFASVVAEYAKEDIKYPTGNFAINYSNKYFIHKKIDELTYEDVRGKIVILGDLKDLRDYVDMDFPISDYRYYDIEEPMYRVPGAYLHAYTISSIINGDWVRIASSCFSKIFGFLYLFLVCITIEFIKDKTNNPWRFVYKGAKLGMVILLFIVLYFIYAPLKVIMDPLYLTIGVAMIGISSTIKDFLEAKIKQIFVKKEVGIS